MRERQYSNADVAAIANTEGWGYMVMHYMSPDYCTDPITQDLFTKARDAMIALEQHLAPYMHEDY